MTPLLQVLNLIKKFGAMTAVSVAQLTVEAGKVHAIIGPNGAGKTTLFNMIAGALQPTSGSILFDGRDITAMRMHGRAHCGIGRSYQITSIFPELTVHENVRLAVQAKNYQKLSLFRAASSLVEITEKADNILLGDGNGKILCRCIM